MRNDLVRPLSEFGKDDVGEVGGKNASLGEMLSSLKQRGVRVPEGVAVTVTAFDHYLDHNDLREPIDTEMERLRSDGADLREVGANIRRMIGRGEFPDDLRTAMLDGYADLCELYGQPEVDVAIRSSATAEDLPDASFAGQQETLLNVTGEQDVLHAVRRCYTSLFTDRAIHYRAEKGYDTETVGLSVTIQKMVRSGSACAGVMFTLDPDSGFPDVVVVNGSWGLGEHLVGGSVEPDEWVVHKPGIADADLHPIIDHVRGAKQSKMVYATGEIAPVKIVDTRRRERETFVLDDDEVMQLARWAVAIEDHYGHPMDIEWAKDGDTGELFVVQARPETVQSQEGGQTIRSYALHTSDRPIVEGIAIGASVAAGPVKILTSLADADRFVDGDVLVTEMTDPDWVPLMSRASAVVTDRGGRTAHAAIISRELGVTAVVGSGEATRLLTDGQQVTVSCVDGDSGKVFDGVLDWETEEIDLTDVPETTTQIMMNLASPGAALNWWRMPADGIGLARMEFIINDHIKVHPLALLRFDDVTDPEVRHIIEGLAIGYDDLADYFVDRVTHGVARIAASQYPKPVIVRLSDFKSNEYADLVGGRQFEPEEENPMLGWRGARRYYSPAYRAAFDLECRALARVRGDLGLDNVIIMVPFCRTPGEADKVLEILAANGLARGENGLQVYVMCEIPANVLLADEFAERFDGFSIGSNDLTQLTLGVDRDSGELQDLFDERDPAVKRAITMVVEAAKRTGTKVGICGQGPSDHPDFAEFLVGLGIDSMSLNPDVVISTRHRVAELEAAGVRPD
ncbi:phosphoenolpyruvate synthase [Salsipaludibacter albus]|uniref:phosphoenolpyruvate synthase n=1 Tax=Salsipaludibacter albus TaxID=2849650 RepID=UPI001EE42750|nr:phosphoenolpyruvate synthase [Salsipaludibacter albus]MBY5164422.1 phosphoenolpyruvate synthase [Salsipaludibacter albus]